jgi:hypothetical protein
MPMPSSCNSASRGELRKNLDKQVTRMLADPRAENLARNFTGQWLQARDVEGIASNPRDIILRDAGEEAILERCSRPGRRRTRRPPRSSPRKSTHRGSQAGARPRTSRSHARETEMYFAYVMREDRPVTEFIDSNYTFVNEELAKYYGIPDVQARTCARSRCPRQPARRHADPGQRVAGDVEPGPHLAREARPVRAREFPRHAAPAAAGQRAGARSQRSEFKDGHEPVLRDVLKLHREAPMCSSCHNRMDPIGLAFENFNAIGGWRDTERKQPIVAQGNLITGETFNSVSELKKILANDHRDEFYHTLTSKLMTYATGRGMEYYDVETIDQIVQRLQSQDGKFGALLTGIIESAPFQKMRTSATVTAAN